MAAIKKINKPLSVSEWPGQIIRVKKHFRTEQRDFPSQEYRTGSYEDRDLLIVSVDQKNELLAVSWDDMDGGHRWYYTRTDKAIVPLWIPINKAVACCWFLNPPKGYDKKLHYGFVAQEELPQWLR